MSLISRTMKDVIDSSFMFVSEMFLSRFYLVTKLMEVDYFSAKGCV